MIIDADCHISARKTGIDLDPDELVRQMDALGVDKAVCWPIVSYTREIAGDNQTIYAGAKAHPDRMIPFGGVNPRLGMDQAKDELKRCIEVYGFKGVKLNGARDGYYIDDPALSLPLVEMIAAAGLVLSFHCGSNDFEKTHPYRVAKISALYPDLPIMLIHMGGSHLPTMHDAVIDLAEKHPQWYLVDSESDYRKIHKALKVLGPSRLCYGSDAPFCPMRYEWGMRHVAYQDLDEAGKAMVFGGNIARLFKIR